MKRILGMVMLLFTVAACTTSEDDTGSCGCGGAIVQDTNDCSCDQQPQPQQENVRYVKRYRVQNYQTYDQGCEQEQVPGCSGCKDQIRTEREPVEVVYRRTTHRTVFQPRTFTTTNYERVPYSERTSVSSTPCSGRDCGSYNQYNDQYDN